MSGTRETLARRYRRLLLCYPRQYRRTRGSEIVATFLDLAPPDRARPTVREAGNLVRNGLRCRLGRPHSRTVVLWAGVTAIVWALFAGAFGTRVGWETARPLPTQAQARELFTQLLGRDPGDVYADPAMFVIYGQPLGWNNLGTLFSIDAGEFQQGRASATLNGPGGASQPDLVDSTRSWLRANGWRVSDVDIRHTVGCLGCDESTMPRKAVYSARRADDVLTVGVTLRGAQQFTRPVWVGDRFLPPTPAVAGSYMETYFHVELTRATPVAVYPFGVAGALLGMVFGWLMFGWASRRTEGRAVATALFGVALFMWCAPMVLGLASMLAHHRSEQHLSWHPMWEWLGVPGYAPLFMPGTVAALSVLALAALPRRRAQPDHRSVVTPPAMGRP